MSKFNTGNLPLRGILHVIRSKSGWHLLSWARRALPPCKVWRDRTTHAGCRFENVVFLCLLSAVYREVANCRYQKYLLTGQRSGSSPRLGVSLHKFTSNLAPKMKKARKTKLFISIPDPIQPDLVGKGVETFHHLRGQIQLN